MAILETQELTYTYSMGTPFEKTAVDHVSLKIEEGEMVGVMGHTGSGKSTLIQHFNGLLKPTSGKVLLDGKDIWADKDKIRDVRFKVGLVFQYPEYQIFEETVYKDIAFGPGNMGLSKDEIDARVRKAASFTGLSEEILEKSPFDLSGGQKRRVAIAGVLAMEPKYLILDEPAAGLDPTGRDDILTKLKQYQREKHTSVVIISHSMEDMANYCDRIIVLKKSGVYKCGGKNEIFSDPMALSSLGLSVPQITKVIYNANQLGLGVNEPIYTVDAAYDLVMKMISPEGVK